MGEAKRRREADEAAKRLAGMGVRVTQQWDETGISQEVFRGMLIRSEMEKAGKAPGQSDGAPVIEISCPACHRKCVGAYMPGTNNLTFSYPPHDGDECLERATIGDDPKALYCSRFKRVYLKALSDNSAGFVRSQRRRPPPDPRRGKSVIEL